MQLRLPEDITASGGAKKQKKYKYNCSPGPGTPANRAGTLFQGGQPSQGSSLDAHHLCGYPPNPHERSLKKAGGGRREGAKRTREEEGGGREGGNGIGSVLSRVPRPELHPSSSPPLEIAASTSSVSSHQRINMASIIRTGFTVAPTATTSRRASVRVSSSPGRVCGLPLQKNFLYFNVCARGFIICGHGPATTEIGGYVPGHPARKGEHPTRVALIPSLDSLEMSLIDAVPPRST